MSVCRLACAGFLLFLPCSVLTACGGSFHPSEIVQAQTAASAVGYMIHTLSTHAFTTANVDKNLTYRQGFEWYLNDFYNYSPSSAEVTLNPDGTLTTNSNNNGIVASVGRTAASPYYVGTAFGCGGYFDISFSVDLSTLDVSKSNSWPAWWGMDIYNSIGQPQNEQWTGRPTGYDHFMEFDFMEMDIGNNRAYGGTLHDTYGIYNSTCVGWCHYTVSTQIEPQAANDFKMIHHYGTLWVPATSAAQGYVKFFYDGIQQGPSISWSQYVAANTTEPPSASAPWALGVLDEDHLVLQFGSATTTPMTVQSVDVWQGINACNLKN